MYLTDFDEKRMNIANAGTEVLNRGGENCPKP